MPAYLKKLNVRERPICTTKIQAKTTPSKFIKVNVSVGEKAGLARQRYAEHHKIDFPHLHDGGDNQVCRIYFNNNTSRVVTRW